MGHGQGEQNRCRDNSHLGGVARLGVWAEALLATKIASTNPSQNQSPYGRWAVLSPIW
ncbi:MAG: hypothetical protein ACK583_00560 [Cyanobacteriota bacterium]